MPIVHTCKACGCQVTEAEVARGQAVRKGKFTYCGECSALILDPVEMAAPAAAAQPARPARPAPGAHQGLPEPDQSPTGRQNALARNGIEVVEEFEIMSGNEDVPDLDAALEGDDVGHDDQADIDTNPGAEPLDEAPARPSARAARAGRAGRGDRGAGGSGSRRGVGGRGTNLGRRQQARASAHGAGGAGGSSSRRPAAGAPAAKPESRRGAKEVFYKSGAKAPAINAVDVADQGNAVESNVLDAVRANQARKASGGGGGGSRRSQRSGGGRSSSRMSGRSSSRTSGRGEDGGRGSMRGRAPSGGNNQTVIIGSIAGVIVLIGLVLMLSSGSNKGANRSGGSESHVSAGTYASQAKEKERAGERIAAYELYLKAAEAAEAAGRDEEARSYSMRAYAMQKHSTLQMGR